MRYHLFAAILALESSGCATYTYKAPNGESIIINRGLTNDQFDEVTATGPGGRTLTVRGYTSDQVKALAELKGILKLLVEGAAKGVTP